MKKLLLFLAIIFSTHSHALEFQGKFLQGHFILGKAEAGSKVFVDKTQVKVSEDGYFVFGIDRDRKFDVAITEINNGKKNKIIKKVFKRKYNIQKLMVCLKIKLHHQSLFIKGLKKKMEELEKQEP